MILVFVLLISLCGAVPNNLKLKTVLALSRHATRTPLTENLRDFSPNEWPKWENGPGVLTERGTLLEGYMAEFVQEWLSNEQLLPKGCPETDSVYIYANTRQRTKETAKVFANSAFKDCNVSIHYLNIEEMDPIFNPVVHNASEEFEKIVTQEMEGKLNELDITDSLAELGRVLNLKESRICKEKGYCDFNKDKDTVVFEIGEELDTHGPIKIGNAIVDAFIMSYYDGRPQEEIAWGAITSPEQWKLLTTLSKENQNVRFNLTTAYKDIAGPLLKYMTNVLLNNNSTRKFTLLVGHDSNLNPVVKAFNFKPYVLKNQYEPFPIGGMLVFEKWSNDVEDFFKIEYIYQSWSQLRDGAKLNLDNPPQRIVMELKDCKIDENGLCPWDNFVQLLNDLI